MNTEFLPVSEGKIAYDDSGSGPLVLCVPGMGDLRSEFRFLRPQLEAAGYRVVTMDVRGHGETSTHWRDYSVAGVGADIIALLQHLNVGPAVIVGNSMAAGAAVWAAAEGPELVRALALLGPAVRNNISWGYQLLFKALFARPWGPSAWLMYYNRLFITQKPSDLDGYNAILKRNLSQPGRMEALQAMIVAPQSASEARLSQVNVPTLSMMGSKDPDFKDPEGEVKWIAGQLRGSYRIIPGAGHYPQTEMPGLTGPLILDFLKTLEPEASYAAHPA